MSDHPATLRGDDQPDGGIAWDDRAALHQASDGGGLLGGAKALRHGSLAELVGQVMAMPPEQRRGYAIEKLGDHRLELAEIEQLAARPDFPG